MSSYNAPFEIHVHGQVPLRQVALVKVVKGNRELVLQEAPDPALVPAPKL